MLFHQNSLLSSNYGNSLTQKKRLGLLLKLYARQVLISQGQMLENVPKMA